VEKAGIKVFRVQVLFSYDKKIKDGISLRLAGLVFYFKQIGVATD